MKSSPNFAVLSKSEIFPVDVDVAILGAGFCGSLLAVHLTSALEGPTVALIDKSGSHGAGLAYGAAGKHHLLNVPAGRMSAFPDEWDHFLNWIRNRPELMKEFGFKEIEAGAFLPRLLYGRYLTWLVTTQASDSRRLNLVNADVQDIVPEPGALWRLVFADGASIVARTVVLAFGNFPSTHPIGISPELLQTKTFLPSPWSQDAIHKLAGAEEILILGTGLTALDLLSTLKDSTFRCVHLLSRRGLTPHPHDSALPHDLQFTWKPLPPTVRGMLRLMRTEIHRAAAKNVNWRVIVDSLRPHIQAIWQGWERKERWRFLRHLRPYWEVVRHRAAPQAFQFLEELRSKRRLKIHRGRLQRIESSGSSAVAIFRPRGGGKEVRLHVESVVNCTGPETDLTKVNNPLVKRLISQGLIKPDGLGLGMDVEEDGAVLNAKGESSQGLYALGGLRKGSLWESTAVPELRSQAAALSDLLHGQWTSCAADPSHVIASSPVEPDWIWMYEI